MTDPLIPPAPLPVNPIINVRPVEVSPAAQGIVQTQTQLAVLPTGTVIEGFVLRRDNKNNPVVRTAYGDLQLQSDLFIKTGSQVIFRVDPGNQSRARILTIDGVVPEDYAAKSTPGIQEDVVEPPFIKAAPAESTPAANQAPRLANSASLDALLLSKFPLAKEGSKSIGNNDNAVRARALLAPLTSGSGLKVTLIDVQFPKNALREGAKLPSSRPPVTEMTTTIRDFMEQASLPAQPMNSSAASAASLPAGSALLRSLLPGDTAPVAQTSPTPATVTPSAAAPVPANTIPPVTAGDASSVLPQAPVHAGDPQTAATAAATESTDLRLGGHAAIPASASPLPPAALPSAIPLVSSPAVALAQEKPLSAPPATGTPPVEITLPEAPPAQGIHALVIGHEADGASVLHTALGAIKLFTPRALPTGTLLAIDVAPNSQFVPMTESAATPKTPSLQSNHWPLLEDVSRDYPVEEIPAPIASLIERLPSAGPSLTSTLLFFISAVKGGSPLPWIGSRGIDRLSAELPKIAARLKNDFAQMQEMWVHSPLQEWRSALLPIVVEQHVHYARLYMRDEHTPEQSTQASSGGQRFVVDVELSQLGTMQFDGFVRSREQKQFDLVIRSARPLDSQLVTEIRTIFDDSSQITGYRGYLGFQQGAQHFVRPLAALKPVADGRTILA